MKWLMRIFTVSCSCTCCSLFFVVSAGRARRLSFLLMFLLVELRESYWPTRSKDYNYMVDGDEKATRIYAFDYDLPAGAYDVRVYESNAFSENHPPIANRVFEVFPGKVCAQLYFPECYMSSLQSQCNVEFSL